LTGMNQPGQLLFQMSLHLYTVQNIAYTLIRHKHDVPPVPTRASVHHREMCLF
jgi:hypothetical protein